ncbi:MAG: sigma-54-dependent Fis family transcriptional regulator [Myxococcota bacterium]
MTSAAHGRTDPAAAALRERSLHRSLQVHGLHPGRSALPARLTQRELTERREHVDDALGEAQRAVASLAEVAERAGCVLLMAAPDGVVVRRHNRGGDPEYLGAALDEGSFWEEAVAGNNAVGTALVEKRPVSFHGSDHCLAVLHPYSCTAVPLWDGHQRLVGVLDLTTVATKQAHAPFLRDALERRALAVHTALFTAAFPEHCLIEVRHGPLDALERSSALVALASDGSVAGLTRAASRWLASRPSTSATTALGALVGERLTATLSDLRDAALGTTRTSGAWSVRVAREGGTRRRRPSFRRRAAKPARLDLDRLAGDDATARRHRRALRRLAETELPILLGGETGTGKDAWAKAIHAASPRAAHPFVAVNCASLPESLLDAELFGYAPGTFTGGLKSGKPGKMEAAHRGTLFLDEIGDMPLPLQGRLLRVLAEREVTRVGAVTPVPVDFQLVAATHRDLAAQVASGRFREDLLYRLRGAYFRLPALRERTDLEALVRRLAPRGTSFAPEALALLLAYRWPGNIRQLKQVLTFAAACADDGRVTAADLPPELRAPEAEAPAVLADARRSSERQALLRTLGATGWNVSKAAERLGIGRSTLHRKMRQLGIHRPDG